MLLQACDPRGPGYLWKGPQLGNLTLDPATAPHCEQFYISIFHPVGVGADFILSDICQQDVQLVTKSGEVTFDQTEFDPSCL